MCIFTSDNVKPHFDESSVPYFALEFIFNWIFEGATIESIPFKVVYQRERRRTIRSLERWILMVSFFSISFKLSFQNSILLNCLQTYGENIFISYWGPRVMQLIDLRIQALRQLEHCRTTTHYRSPSFFPPSATSPDYGPESLTSPPKRRKY